jgi:uroporphyrin-III C-methyltransferase
MENSIPTVFIVGAGPGDPELITVKGLRAIQCADVILYDALASPELLEYAPAGCKKIYVGKRRGKKEFPQEEINHLIVFYARRFQRVVRLKGGDPNVFGRGHEEMEFVMNEGIQVEMIPGISSALAAPISAGIPLTKRGINESFWVTTGTVSSGEMSRDIVLAAASSATVVILMGMAHLARIASIFQRMRSPQEPIALIQEATTANEKIAIGTAADIVECAQRGSIGSPAVIVVGSVVDERVIKDLIGSMNCGVIAEE